MNNTIPTNYGRLSEQQLANRIMYNAYAASRDEGLTHETLVSFGIGSEEFKRRYDEEKVTDN